MNQSYGYYENNAICNMMICGDGAHSTFKFNVSGGLINSLLGGAPDKAATTIVQDNTGLGVDIVSSVVATLLGVTTCTITFDQNLPVSDPVNGPLIQIQVTFEYASQ